MQSLLQQTNRQAYFPVQCIEGAAAGHLRSLKGYDACKCMTKQALLKCTGRPANYTVPLQGAPAVAKQRQPYSPRPGDAGNYSNSDVEIDSPFASNSLPREVWRSGLCLPNSTKS